MKNERKGSRSKTWKVCLGEGLRLLGRNGMFLACLMLMLLVIPRQTALADGTDTDPKGSIEIELPETGEGVELTLYKIADYVNGTYEYSTDFAGSGVSVGSLGDNEETREAAEKLAAYAEEKEISGTKGTVDADGMLRFENLEPALYLTAQTSGQELLAVQPALVPIPYYIGGTAKESYDAVITAKNTFPGGAVIGTKVDENGKALAKATFVLQEKTYLADGETAPEGAETGTDETGNYYWKELKQELASAENGQFAVRGLDTGDYRFVETAAPEGYVISGTPYPFTISRAGTIEEVDGTYKAGNGKVETLEVVNVPTTIRIKKVDEDGKTLAGAKLALKNANGTLIRDENGLPKYTFTTSDQPYELKKLPAGTYYVTELAAPEGYEVAADVLVELTAEEEVCEVTMVDKKTDPTDASLIVTKKLTDLNGNAFKTESATFYVALFSDEACSTRISDVKTLEFKNSTASSVTFSNLKQDVPYYVGETDQYGELLENGLYGNVVYAAQYPKGRKIQLSGTDKEGTLEFDNVFSDIPKGYYYEGELTVTKKVMRGTTEENSNETFYAAIFTDEGRTQRYGDVIALNMSGKSSTSVTVPVYAGDADTESVRYYISETDKNGTPVNDSMNLAYTVSVDKGSVVVSMENSKAEVVITNTYAEEETEVETETEIETETEEDAITGGSSSSGGGVKTGDDTPIWLFAVLLAVSVILIIVILMFRRKRSRKS